MAFLPPSSMPYPRWFYRQTATVTVTTVTQETAGSWDRGAGTSYTVPCYLQPASSADSAIYKRETGRTLYDLYLDVKATDGTAITAAILNHISRISIDSVAYVAEGEYIDLASNGVVYKLQVSREV